MHKLITIMVAVAAAGGMAAFQVMPTFAATPAEVHANFPVIHLAATAATTVTDISTALGDQAGSVASGLAGLVASNALGLGAVLGGVMVVLFLPSLIRRFFPKK